MVDDDTHDSRQNILGPYNAVEQNDSCQLITNDIKNIHRNPIMRIGKIENMPRQTIA